MQRRILQYQETLTGKLKESNNQTKPFSFLNNIGGKDTTQEGMTLRTGPDYQRGPNLMTASALLISSAKDGRAANNYKAYAGAEGQSEKSSEQMMAIFTDMNVDMHYQKT